MSLPLVSVLMPIYNNTAYAGVAIESILDQTLTDLEFIIVDDGSDMATQTLLAEYAASDGRITLLRNQKNLGYVSSLNRGLSHARGKYIARQDSDDISTSRRLETQVAYLQANTAVGLLGTSYKVIDNYGVIVANHRLAQTDTEIRWQMLFHNAFCHTSVIYRSSLLGKHQLKYDEEQTYVDDYDLWTRMLPFTQVANLPEQLVFLRKHSENVSVKHQKTQYQRATKIADRQIQLIWPKHPFSLSEIETLRLWYHDFPKKLTKQNMMLCRALFKLIAAFEQQPNIDPFIVKQIYWLWFRRILGATNGVDGLSLSFWQDMSSSKLLWTLFRHTVPAAIVLMPTWFRRKANRRHKGLPQTTKI